MHPIDCAACSRPLGVVKAHHTTYDGGECSPLCETCWTGIRTPKGRLRYYRRQWLQRYTTTILHREWRAIRRAVLSGG